MALDKDSLRCLRIIAKSGAQLETPLGTVTLQLLFDRGYIKEVGKYQAAWGGRMHDVVRLAITDKGMKALPPA